MNKNFLAGFALSLMLVAPAMAADLPNTKGAPVYAPPPAANWSGFYIDAGAGYGMWSADTTTVNPFSLNCDLCLNQEQGGRGFLGTVGAGYDYQLNDHIVAGVFADGDFGSINGTIQDQTPFFVGQTRNNWSWDAGGRLGWLITPQMLVYGKAGFTQAHFTGADMVSTSLSQPTAFSTKGFTTNGWFVGGGVETMFAPGWFWRTDYRVAGYGARNLVDNCPGCVVENDIRFRPIVQTVTSGIVYKFNSGGPGLVGVPNLLEMLNFAPAPPVSNWTGIYADAGVGYGMWTANTSTINPVTGNCFLCGNQEQGGRGVLGTVGAGYDYQFNNRIVAGITGDADFSGIKGSIQDQQPFSVGTTRNDWSWDAGARLGWLVTPEILTYTKAGFAEAHFTGTNMASNFTGPSGFSTRGFTTNGWFLGGGIEAMVSPGWFWRGEYRVAQYGAHNIADCFGAACHNSIRFRPEEQTVTTGLVYKFNWANPSPVVAKY